MTQDHNTALAGQRGYRLRWQWCLPILGLALVIRLTWLFSPFNYDATTITACMRAMTQGGVSQVLATIQDRIHLPWELYLLLLPGWFSQGAPAGAAPTLIEMLALRLSLIFTDLLAVAAVYRMGRNSATASVALVGAALYAVWPASVYVDGWWAQTDIWYVAFLLLATWWLARKRVQLAWLALALSVAVKWQAAMVLPVFVVGTWRWCGWRGLVKGALMAGAVWGVSTAPIVLKGQLGEFLAKSLYQSLPPFVVERAHNFWFAAVPIARVMEDRSLDLNPWLGGVSFHAAGLIVVVLLQAIIAGRLFWRSGPQAIAAAGALAILATTMFMTQVSTRHYLAAPALLLVAGFFDRKWWGVYVLLITTQLINLVWESGTLSPWWNLMPIPMSLAIVNAWANLGISALSLGLFLRPLLDPPARQARFESPLQARRPRLESMVLSLGGLCLVAGSAAYLWRGRELGASVLGERAPLMASLQQAMAGATPAEHPDERVLVINWPWEIDAHPSGLLGMLPVASPSLIFDWPYAPAANVRLVQFAPWQSSAPGTQVHFRNNGIEAYQVRNLLSDLGIDRIIDFHPSSNQMYLLAERLPAATGPGCRAEFGQGICLLDAATSAQGGELRLDLTWQTSQTLEPDLIVSARVTGPGGELLTQVDADLVRDVLPLARWPAQNGALHEARWLKPSADHYQIWIGVYHTKTGQWLPTVCSPTAICGANGLQVFTR